MKLISIVIPVFRNRGSLKITHQEVVMELQKCDTYDYEFIFVNDGSDDGSLEELLDVRKTDGRVKVIDLSRNFGQSQAILAGIAHAKGDLLISLSADLQDPTDKIPEMVLEYEAGNDVVICNRPVRHDKLKDKTFAKLYYMLMKTSNLKIPEGGFDLFLLSRKATNVLLSIGSRNRHLHADILWLGFSTKLIPSIRRRRTIGKSQYSFFKKFNSLVSGYINSSYLPIRAMSFLGFMFAFIGFIYAILIVYAYFAHRTPFQGWAPIMILILIIGGLIMLMLGIIGEYLWRVFDETKQRPYYVVKDIYD